MSDSEITTRILQVQDLVRCLTALSVRPVAALGSWVQLDKEIANDVGGAGYSYSGALFDTTVYRASFKPAALDGGSIYRLISFF